MKEWKQCILQWDDGISVSIRIKFRNIFIVNNSSNNYNFTLKIKNSIIIIKKN